MLESRVHDYEATIDEVKRNVKELRENRSWTERRLRGNDSKGAHRSIPPPKRTKAKKLSRPLRVRKSRR